MSSKRNGPTPGKGREARAHNGLGKPVKENLNTDQLSAQYAEKFEKLFDEAAGLYSLSIVTPHNILALPPGLAENSAVAIGQWMGQRREAARPPLCLLCPTEFLHEIPFAFSIVCAASSDDPNMLMLSGICEKCASVDPDILLSRANKMVCDTMFPDAVDVTLTWGADHA